MPCSRNPRRYNGHTRASHLSAFFARYPEFDYNPSAPVMTEFYRLLKFHDREPKSQHKREARAGFSEAMGKQFAAFYGTRANDVNAWQALCVALRVDPVPKTIDECREVIRSTHVNLVDFIETRMTGEPIKIFKTVDELRAYTKAHGKYFPRDSAKESGVLRHLLRKILEIG